MVWIAVVVIIFWAVMGEKSALRAWEMGDGFPRTWRSWAKEKSPSGGESFLRAWRSGAKEMSPTGDRVDAWVRRNAKSFGYGRGSSCAFFARDDSMPKHSWCDRGPSTAQRFALLRSG